MGRECKCGSQRDVIYREKLLSWNPHKPYTKICSECLGERED